MKNNSLLGFLGIILGAGLMTVGTMDYDDAQAAQAHYCSMIDSGAWPAYKGTEGCTEKATGDSQETERNRI